MGRSRRIQWIAANKRSRQAPGLRGLDIEKAQSDRLYPCATGVLANVEALGIRQTPTFFINGKRLENFSAASLIADVCFAVESA
jgi:protein-disulfide isomerase